jgi:hypothetical protein
MKLAAIAFGVAFSLAVSRAHAADPLIVHEWGTFTCLQDETGRAIGAINSDDEPVPAFVHHAGIPVDNSNETISSRGKWTPIDYPPVTMRLETPVIYFHRPPGAPTTKVRVDVAFHGGWLTEFYPLAQVTSPGESRRLAPDTVGTLSWPKVSVGSGATLVTTTDHLWTTPRQAKSDPVSVGGESENFLFYRGVGDIDSPLRVTQVGLAGVLRISMQKPQVTSWRDKEGEELAHSPMWLVRVTPDGHIRWRRGYSPAIGLQSASVLGETRVGFPDDSVGLDSLHKDMAEFLVKAGLFPDEAEAMLNTWQVSYFKSPGLRLFFLSPQAWIHHTLPLKISGDPKITRVMIGRIEIITPEQRRLIREIETTRSPDEEPADVVSMVEQRMAAGDPLSEAVKDLAPADRSYALLGRFRHALLIDEQAHRPNRRLADFMEHHQIPAE